MQLRNLLKSLERRIGTARAAGWYYNLVFAYAPHLGVSCFNYGYAEADDGPLPEPPDERYQLALYRETVQAAGEERLAGAVLLEISSGLGGGLRHIAERFPLRLALGAEFIRRAVQSARRRFGVAVVEADARDLRLPSGAFDVVINVEASHVYFGDRFLAEVARALRPGGCFVLTDNRLMTPADAQDWLARAASPHGLRLMRFRDITGHVQLSCERDTPRREQLLRRVPRPLRASLREMLGCTGTAVYENMKQRRTCYFIASFTKEQAG